ncbi:C4-dicarboxylate TRAP transporter substrate-binding protein [Marinobacterium mangrovicola]|uniref:TRAP-type C4-dicarboxylate transport system substrate-binding protein n=1 Tax=Marinobacterium mangrovicola TaxID=1476959 RepID=A0A4R1GC35_9GAMM|nr:C4-dicarboxylate TRAP transporter substrate-binding protein [Marinobacterium mangrovicola]TCK04321.1 TRAP-type C4-dicarboxylate transport system substrate-binding protein [Marinobacterium mangrovicola]
MKNSIHALTGAVAISLAFTAFDAEAKTIRAVSGFGPSHVMATTAFPKMDEKLREFTDGEWKVRDTPSGLISVGEMNKGLKDSVVEMGTMVLPYFAADYPESMLPGELSIIGTDNWALASAASEYVSTCKECVAEFAKNGQVYTGSDATTTYELLTTKPVRSAEDLQGMRIRTPGSVFTRFISDMGGEAIQMPTSDMFEAMNSGVIDGTYSATSDLKNVGLYDVVKYVTNINQGVFNSAAMPNVSHRLWNDMNEEERHALVRAAQYAQTYGGQGWRDARDEATEEALKRDIEFIEPSEEFETRMEAFRSNHLQQVTKTLTDRGVTNAQEKVDRYLALVEKWSELVKTVNSADELAELRYKEIWADRKLTDYGN